METTKIIPIGAQGKLRLGYRDYLSFLVKESSLAQNINAALRLQHFYVDETGTLQAFENLRDNPDTTLYFNHDGKIVDGTPCNSWTSVRDCQQKYSGPIRNYLDSIVPLNQQKREQLELTIDSIKGFFEGEEGIERTRTYDVELADYLL